MPLMPDSSTSVTLLRAHARHAPWNARGLAAHATALVDAAGIRPTNASARAAPSARAVRFYVASGLLDRPEGTGTGGTGPIPLVRPGAPAHYVAQGTRIDLNDQARHIGTQIVDEPGAVCWNELLTTSPATAREFYTKLFGHLHQAAPGAAGQGIDHPHGPDVARVRRVRPV